MPSAKGHVYYRDLLEMHLEGGISPGERDVLLRTWSTATSAAARWKPNNA